MITRKEWNDLTPNQKHIVKLETLQELDSIRISLLSDNIDSMQNDLQAHELDVKNAIEILCANQECLIEKINDLKAKINKQNNVITRLLL